MRRAAVPAGILLAVLFGCPVPAWADGGTAPPSGPKSVAASGAHNHDVGAKQETPASAVTQYTLAPDMHEKARRLGRLRLWGTLVGFAWTVGTLWLFLRWRWGARFRTWAERASARRFIQALIFTAALVLTVGVLSSPLAVIRQAIGRRYGFSIQGWGSWLWDWLKSQLVSVVLGTILVWIVYGVIRRSSRRWWLYFWLASLPIGLAVFVAQPVVIDPLFFKYEPLASKEPALTETLQRVVRAAGQDIPPERMFWMGAGEKVTFLNASVEGFGASKRIVIWDTTIKKMATPQIVWVVGHEVGHYVLGHIPKLLCFGAVVLLALFYLSYRSINRLLARWGPAWGVRGLDDWASLPALLLLLTVFLFGVTPAFNVFTRHFEGEADRYALEVTRPLIPDAGQACARAFQAIGESILDEPDPSPLAVLLVYDHPPIRDRILRCLDPQPFRR
jgi:STE24 endopeptidase